MAVSQFTQLIAWQLADQLRAQVFAFTAKEPTARDFRFCRDIRASAESAPSNTAEGFARFRPPEFLYFLRIARASLAETQDHLRSALQSDYITPDGFTGMWRLGRRAIMANTGLQRYLTRCIEEGWEPGFD